MDRYIEQLLEELNQLQQAASCWQLSLTEILFENISLEEEVAWAPRLSLQELLGIQMEAFPPAHLLSNRNRVSLLFALEDALRALGYQPCYPIRISSLSRYVWLREQLPLEVPVLKHHTWPLRWQNAKETVYSTQNGRGERPVPIQGIDQQ